MTTTPQTDPTTADPDTVMVSGFRINRLRILGTTTWLYHAWAPMDGIGLGSPYSTITHQLDRWWGRVGTARLPERLEALPAMSEERATQVRAWQATQYELAYDLIVQAFPEAEGGSRSMGGINVEREAASS